MAAYIVGGCAHSSQHCPGLTRLNRGTSSVGGSQRWQHAPSSPSFTRLHSAQGSREARAKMPPKVRTWAAQQAAGRRWLARPQGRRRQCLHGLCVDLALFMLPGDATMAADARRGTAAATHAAISMLLHVPALPSARQRRGLGSPCSPRHCVWRVTVPHSRRVSRAVPCCSSRKQPMG